MSNKQIPPIADNTLSALRSVGKACFVNCFELTHRQNGHITAEQVGACHPQAGISTLGTRASSIRRIFREGHRWAALNSCREGRVDADIQKKANNLYLRFHEKQEQKISAGKIHIFMDLENHLSGNEAQTALEWLKQQGKLMGRAFTAMEDGFTTWISFLEEHNIETIYVQASGMNAADAALLMRFGENMKKIAQAEHFVCFFGTDQIYNQAVEIALEKKIKILRFGKNSLAEWKPQNKGTYKFFDLNQPDTWKFPK